MTEQARRAARLGYEGKQDAHLIASACLHRLGGRQLDGTQETELVLDDPCSFYLPFETVFARYFLSRAEWLGKTRVACVSSACLSFEVFYGVPCVLGFGEQNVRKYMRPEWIAHRLRHEHDLRITMQRLREARLTAVAA